MPGRKMALLCLLLLSVTVFSQQNFSYSPQHPKPGDVISITYEPAGALAGTMMPVEATYHMLGYQPGGYKNLAADEIKLTRNGKIYAGNIITDTAAHFIYLGFSSNKQFDKNFNDGYYILLYENDKPKRGANFALSQFYQFNGRSVGLEPDNTKALESLKNEMNLYPENRTSYLNPYYRLMNTMKLPEVASLAQTEIEAFLKAGLTSEDDYQSIEMLYNYAKLPEHGKFMASLKKEKFPQGKWARAEWLRNFNMEKDPNKVENLLAELEQKVKNDPAWKDFAPNIANYYTRPAYAYAANKDWSRLKAKLPTIQFGSDADKASFFNNNAWEIQKTGKDMDYAEAFSKLATEYAKMQVIKPSEKKPPYLTTKQWEAQRKGTYAMYADTYAMVMYRMGEYKKGFPYAKDAAIVYEKRKNASNNNTYALLAEKILPAKQFRKELEDFIKTGSASSDMKSMLKNIYTNEKGSAVGFDDYVTGLEKEQLMRMMEELRKSMINQAAPSFALLDLNGKMIDIAELKGKVVVVDFWATWCGPCIASFPGMQRIVTKFKDDPTVKFVFIDTWESGENKKKNAADFITANQYNFHVLLDENNKVVEQFKVEGIPTKFIIDKNSVIRFKSVGFNGNDDQLVAELSAMIDLAARQSENKTF